MGESSNPVFSNSRNSFLLFAILDHPPRTNEALNLAGKTMSFSNTIPASKVLTILRFDDSPCFMKSPWKRTEIIVYISTVVFYGQKKNSMTPYSKRV